MKDIPPYYILNEDGTANTSKRSLEGKQFSKKFISSFHDNMAISLPKWDEEGVGLDRYVKELYFSIVKDFEENKDWQRTIKYYEQFKYIYSVHLRWPVYEFFIDFLVEQNKIEEALIEWNSLREEEWNGIMDWTYRESGIDVLHHFEMLMKKNIIDGRNIYHIAPKGNQLTKFGKANLKEVLAMVDIIIKEEYDGSFFSQFYDNYALGQKKQISYTPDYYDRYFEHNNSFKRKFKQVKAHAYTALIYKDGTSKREHVYFAMASEASRLLREAENKYRAFIGASKIGEGWISETELYYKIKKHFSKNDVIQHGRPDWLGRQHFDIWIPSLNIAIEYQGAQHDKSIDFFGGEKALLANQKRDKLKKEKCRANNCFLLEVRPGYDILEVISQIEDAHNC
jgi:hypothetical protein